MMQFSYTAMVLVGPGSVYTDQLRDLLESLEYYEPSMRRVIVIDDDPSGPRDFSSYVSDPAKVTVVASNRRGRGHPVMGGGCLNAMAGFREAASRDVGDFVLKLDTDALVVAPFAGAIRDRIARTEQTGILGACRFSPLGKPRGNEHHVRTFRSIAAWRVPPADRPFTGRRRSVPTTWSQLKLMRLVRRAIARTPELGVHVLGGAYAVTPRALEAMRKAGLLDSGPLWLDTCATEDAVISLYAQMSGFEMVDFAAQGEPFGVTYRGLPFEVEQIVARGYALIHSVKNDPRITEEAIRAFFKKRRQAS